MQEGKCLECGEKVVGRIDKKFCWDSCRVAYHNRNGRDRNGVIKTVNRKLLRNYKILERLNRRGKTKVPLAILKQSNFDFSYFTSTYESSNGKV